MKNLTILCLFFSLCITTKAEDGHSLWLRMIESKQSATVRIDNAMPSATLDIAADELEKYWRQSGNIYLQLSDIVSVENDGFVITRKGDNFSITAPTELGLLYGAYELLRQQSTDNIIKKGGTFISHPYFQYRILNHWDNLNGTIERGFAGRSIFSKDGKTSINSKIIEEYARANASIGINGTVVNNVNASPQILTDANLFRLTDVANILRPYGIRLYLSANFASPMVIDTLKTADPLNPDVRKWWAEKVDHIYKLIPDFGGFLVKANSEGQPGPMDFGRTHADGANMLADALQPYGGIVMWRAFVYAADSPDRANQAYDEFMPLDGKFRPNVILQVKNGPIDFQPREPVSPLFYSIRHTNIMPEFQITQEYTGENVHTCFLATMWSEFFNEVSKADNALFRDTEGTTAIAGVANIGDSRNWCGSDMAQANWYAFGRLAWNPNSTDKQIASEWLMQTFSKAPDFVEPMTTLLCQTHEAVVNYMMPMGLHHIFAGNHHYGPEPWYAPKGVRSDWTPPYYHKADSIGLGFDRTTTGSSNVLQYPNSLSKDLNDIHKCPEKYLLYFHHTPWDFKMNNQKTMWENLCLTYDEGISQAEGFVKAWQSVEQFIDHERYTHQLTLFRRQANDAWWWRDACLLYFQQFSKRPFPTTCPAPRHTLQELMKFQLRMDNYTSAEKFKTP